MAWLNDDNRVVWSTVMFHSYPDNALRYHHGAMFSAIDKDKDVSVDNCATKYSSGWWFKDCIECNLNGEYIVEDGAASSKIVWDWQPMKKASMKIRPMN